MARKRYLFVLVGIVCLGVLSMVISACGLKNQPSDLIQINPYQIRQQSTEGTNQATKQEPVQIPAPLEHPKTIDEAVSQAILKQGDHYLQGEVKTEGHVILDQEEKDGIITVYTVSSFRWFGFENGVFTTISGSGDIPTVMKFSKNQDGEYSLIEYQEPESGSGYTSSIKKMFPKALWDKVLALNNSYPEITQQLEDQARQYLQRIGRNAEVNADYVDRVLVQINTEASNKLFAEYTKYDEELNRFPYWIGSKEYLIDGVRYIYQTTQSKSDDGFDLVTFIKTTEDGTPVLERRYKIVGTEPQLITETDTDSIVYQNAQYGFRFKLPVSWKGYTIVMEKWDGLVVKGDKGGQVVETGPLILIRHPLWTEKTPRQDIPIMVFTLDQWKSLLSDQFQIGAAPIGPTELAHNDKYVFALPARYNYTFLEGYEEVDQILQTNPLQAE